MMKDFVEGIILAINSELISQEIADRLVVEFAEALTKQFYSQPNGPMEPIPEVPTEAYVYTTGTAIGQYNHVGTEITPEGEEINA